MKNNRLWIMLMIIALMMACNLPTNAPAPDASATPELSLEELVSQEAPTETETPLPLPPPPEETATITPTLTPSVPQATPLDQPVNCRFGPSTNYEQVGALLPDAYAQIIGKSDDGGWWQVQNPSGGNVNCWVADSVVAVSGGLDGIPVVAAPQPFITDVKLDIKPDTVNQGSGCPGPAPTFSLKGTVYVNGPLEVKWHFETKKDGSLPEHTLSFSKYGYKEVTYDYTPSSWDKGDYWVRLVITSPNKLFAEVTYHIKCS